MFFIFRILDLYLSTLGLDANTRAQLGPLTGKTIDRISERAISILLSLARYSGGNGWMKKYERNFLRFSLMNAGPSGPFSATVGSLVLETLFLLHSDSCISINS